MYIDLKNNPNARLAAIRAAQLAVVSYRSMLKTKLYAADVAANSLAAIAKKEKENKALPPEREVVEKEKTDMKHLLAGVAAVAALGVALGAGYAYYKKAKEANEDYEEIIFTEDEEFGEVEPVAEEVVIIEDVVPQAEETVETEE
ncbi:MAG: hypothetical protein J6K80_07860 [Oscillospiraceae bacterium]|nr:hypothetical protein [Oscillospiraceae bacterium]